MEETEINAYVNLNMFAVLYYRSKRIRDGIQWTFEKEGGGDMFE